MRAVTKITVSSFPSLRFGTDGVQRKWAAMCGAVNKGQDH